MSAPFALWHPMYHQSGMKRPRGGSGMLTQALARMIQAHGGQIIAGAPVTRILTQNGRAVGAETEGGIRITAGRAVVSGAHIVTTMKMLDERCRVPAGAAICVNGARIGNGFGMIVRYAMRELPELHCAALPGRRRTRSTASGLAVYLSRHCLSGTRLRRLSGRRAVTGSGAHCHDLFRRRLHSGAARQAYPLPLGTVLSLRDWSGDRSWDEIGNEVADRMLAKLAEYAPNVRSAVIDQLVEHPLYLERELGLLRGNVMHLEMSIDQMFMLRPALTMSHYRGPIKGLYLTGASTHPGGGIMGAAGRQCRTDAPATTWTGTRCSWPMTYFGFLIRFIGIPLIILTIISLLDAACRAQVAVLAANLVAGRSHCHPRVRRPHLHHAVGQLPGGDAGLVVRSGAGDRYRLRLGTA